MDIPSYHPHPLLYQGNFWRGEDISQKCYCTTQIKYNDYIFFRYITPSGRSRSVHYFDSLTDAEKAFKEFGQVAPQPVKMWEIENFKAERRFYEKMREQKFYR